MATVNCLYCGAAVPADAAHCPACGAPSHFQRKGENPRRQRTFRILFVLLVLFCLALALWLPR